MQPADHVEFHARRPDFRRTADCHQSHESAVGAAGDADLGDTYYRHWVAALESLVAAKGASNGQELECYRLAWDHAADRTPHGEAVLLTPLDVEAAQRAR